MGDTHTYDDPGPEAEDATDSNKETLAKKLLGYSRNLRDY